MNFLDEEITVNVRKGDPIPGDLPDGSTVNVAEKKGKDVDGDGDVDSDDYLAARDAAIKKAKSMKEGVAKDLEIKAMEASSLEEFLDDVYQDYPQHKGNSDIANYLKNYYLDAGGPIDEGKVKDFLKGAALLAALIGLNKAASENIYKSDPKIKALTSKYEKAEKEGNKKAMADFKKEIKKRKLQWDTGKVDEAKTIELPADTTFTVDLKHLMKKHMAEGKSKEDTIKFTKALMAKLHDKGEVTVDGTKIVFKEGKKKSGYMGYTELAEADEALIQKIVKSLENPNIGTIQDLERRLNNSKKKKEEFEDARDSKGISNYRYYEKIIPKYEELIDFAKHTVKMIKGGADARHHVEELSDKAEKIFPPREYQFGSPLVPVWLDFAKFDKSRERLQTRASDGRIRDLERERNREAGKLGENDTQLALPEPDAQDFLGDDGMDYEGGMAKSQMLKMKKYAMALCDMIDDESQLESWVQAKLTKASDYMSSVYHYLDYQKTKMNEAIGDVIPDGEWQKLDIEWIITDPDVNKVDYQEGPLYGTTEDGRAFESYGYWTPFEDEYRPLKGKEVVEVPLS